MYDDEDLHDEDFEPRPPPPSDLRTAGKRLWREVQAAFEPVDKTLDVRQTAILRLCCKQADDVAALERALKGKPLTVQTASGGEKINPLHAALQVARRAQMRYLLQLELTAPPAGPLARSVRAQKAAQLRWQKRKELMAERHAGP
jgi:phage terminase small subunit